MSLGVWLNRIGLFDQQSSLSGSETDTRFFIYKNKVYKNIRLQWRKIKNMLRTYQGFEKEIFFILNFGEEFSTKYQDLEKKEHVKNIFRLKTEKTILDGSEK